MRHLLSAVLSPLARWLDMPQQGLAGDRHMPRVHAAGHGQSERMVVAPGHEEDGWLVLPGARAGIRYRPLRRRPCRLGQRRARALPARGDAAPLDTAALTLIHLAHAKLTQPPHRPSPAPAAALPRGGPGPGRGRLAARAAGAPWRPPCARPLPASPRPRPLVLPADVTDEAQVSHAFAQLEARVGRLDLLFNNAGVSSRRCRWTNSPSEWRARWWTPTSPAASCARAAFALMKRQQPRGGRIVNNGSISAHVPRPFSAPHTATKHAITGLTRSPGSTASARHCRRSDRHWQRRRQHGHAHATGASCRPTARSPSSPRWMWPRWRAVVIWPACRWGQCALHDR